MHKIISKKVMAEGTICQLEVEAPRIAKKAKPGQFIILKVFEKGEKIPLTMAKHDQTKGTITIIFQVVGKTTAHLSMLKPGDAIQDVVGPLGMPTHIKKYDGPVICVGGGTGVAVLYPITRGYKEAGNEVIGIIGARTKHLLILEDEMRKITDDLKVTTDDGSYGHHGFVTDILKQILEERSNVKMVVGIGPVPMMQFVCKTTEPYKVPTTVSLNPIMVDASGMCGACRVTVGGKTRFACMDGPEFDGHQVDFDEFTKRLRMYEKEEKKSYDLFTKTFSGEFCSK